MSYAVRPYATRPYGTVLRPRRIDLDTGNAAGGLDLAGQAVARWEPAVVPPPVDAPAGQRDDVAVAYRHEGYTVGGTMPLLTVETRSAPRPRHRVLIGGVDVTYFRGRPILAPSYRLMEPLMYESATIELPQINPAFERLGSGALSFLARDKRVIIQRVDDNDDVVAVVYRGVIMALNPSGSGVRVEVGGEFQGPASVTYRPTPVFPLERDLAYMAYEACDRVRVPSSPGDVVDTGIRLRTFGGHSELEQVNQLLALAQNTAGTQWTLMPDPADGRYKLRRKNTTRVDFTVYVDDAVNTFDLRRDFAEEPNRVYAFGVNPRGERITGAVFPGLKQAPAAPYPFTDGRTFGPGTTNEQTDTGDGISVMLARLQTTRYTALPDDYAPIYDSRIAQAIRDLQRDADLVVNGDMDPDTWAALFDLDMTGWSLAWTTVLPMAQTPATRRWRRSASGAIIGRNPGWDPSVMPVDAAVDMGVGFTEGQIREWARTELNQGPNWVGTIRLTTGAVIRGQHNPGDPLTGDRVMHDWEIRPGMNVWLPTFDGGTLLHVATVEHSGGEDGVARTVTLGVDTRARDAMKVWQVIQRNRESRRDPAREWVREHRSSRLQHDVFQPWDRIGGIIEKVPLAGEDWTVFPVVAGLAGTVRSLRLRLEPAREFVVAVFGRRIGPTRLRNQIGNPLTRAGSRRWENEKIRRSLDHDHLLLYAAGNDEQPAGYFPSHKRDPDNPDDGGLTAPTGRWEDDAGFSYYTGFEYPVLWVAVYNGGPDSTIPAGRIMWQQLETGI